MLQALEQQMGVAFADHEAKLGQQQEALAKQSHKGIATLQVQCSAPCTLLYTITPAVTHNFNSATFLTPFGPFIC